MPVVYIHCGMRAYVETALRVTGCLEPVFLLGDASMAPLGALPNVTFVDISRYRADAEILSLRSSYTHASSNAEAFEWFCFERVLILGRFLRERRLPRVCHLDSDCILLKPLREYPLDLSRGTWLVNNDHYHELGFSSVPAASIHAAVLDAPFCAAFETLLGQMYGTREVAQPLLLEARERLARGGAGGVSDMTLYFLLQTRADRWREHALGRLQTHDLGRVVELGGGGKATFFNNICTGEGPDSRSQFALDARTRTMALEVRGGGTFAWDTLHGERVEAFCLHFSGAAKRHLDRTWLSKHVALPSAAAPSPPPPRSPPPPPVLYVVCRFDEPLEWLAPLGAAVVVYNKGAACAPPEGMPRPVQVPNVGRESEAYLRFVLDRYDALPEIVVFSQARIDDHLAAWCRAERGPWSGGTFAPADFLRCLADAAAAHGMSPPSEVVDAHTSDPNWRHDWNRNYYGSSAFYMPGSYRGGVQRPFSAWFEQLVGEPYPRDSFVACTCGVFAVSRERIRRRSRAYYVRLLAEVSWASDPVEGHFLERSWCYIFGPPAPPLEHRPSSPRQKRDDPHDDGARCRE